MANTKRPYMKFWTVDWENDPHVRLMSAYDRGVYISLIVYNWNHGAFDAEGLRRRGQLAALLRLDGRGLAASWRRIRPRFVQLENTKYMNRRVLRELGLVTSGQHPDSYPDPDSSSSRAFHKTPPVSSLDPRMRREENFNRNGNGRTA